MRVFLFSKNGGSLKDLTRDCEAAVSNAEAAVLDLSTVDRQRCRTSSMKVPLHVLLDALRSVAK